MTKKPKGLPFFRDLGGIECADGKKVVPGQLFRSGHLNKLKDADGEKLRDVFHITHVVDLRSDSEVSEKPDVLADNVAYHRFPALDDEQNPSVNRKNRLTILQRLMSQEGGTRKHLCDTYRMIVSSPAALEAYRRFFRLLLDSPAGVLWHCTQGKDRTGIGTAALLMVLGAERTTILEDYLRYNRLCTVKNALIFLGVSVAKLSLRMARQLNDLMCARADYLNAAFDEIDRRYGGTSGFIRDALGLSDESILKIRDMYLA